MGAHYVHRIEDVKTPGDIYMPPVVPFRPVRIAPCTHTGRKLSTVRLTCGGGTAKVCPACGEVVR
jgi:hypothetical protein